MFEHLKHFSTHSGYSQYIENDPVRTSISLCNDENTIHIDPNKIVLDENDMRIVDQGNGNLVFIIPYSDPTGRIVVQINKPYVDYYNDNTYTQKYVSKPITSYDDGSDIIGVTECFLYDVSPGSYEIEVSYVGDPKYMLTGAIDSTITIPNRQHSPTIMKLLNQNLIYSTTWVDHQNIVDGGYVFYEGDEFEIYVGFSELYFNVGDVVCFTINEIQYNVEITYHHDDELMYPGIWRIAELYFLDWKNILEAGTYTLNVECYSAALDSTISLQTNVSCVRNPWLSIDECDDIFVGNSMFITVTTTDDFNEYIDMHLDSQGFHGEYSGEVKNGKVTFEIYDLPEGTYTVTAIYENEDNMLYGWMNSYDQCPDAFEVVKQNIPII